MNDAWKAEIAQGIAFYKGGNYKEATEAFDRAAALNPNDPIPHIYLGLALQAQFIPNGQQHAGATRAYEEFQRAIALDRSAWPPLIFMAKLERDLGSIAESRKWYEQALQLDPSNADVYVALGALAMQSGVADQDSARTDFERALAVEPRNVGAMRFLDAFYRARGNESGAAGWRRKARAIETENSLRIEQQRQRGIISPLRWPSPLAGTYQIIRDMAVVSPPPPPPPPPPPSPRGQRLLTNATPAGWTFRQVPDPDGEPPPMLVNPIAQERNLVRKVDPAFPANASGTVRIGIIVAEDGKVRKATFVEGDSGLADAAVTAVRQWTYRPTISNWKPVEVRSEVLLRAGRAQ